MSDTRCPTTGARRLEVLTYRQSVASELETITASSRPATVSTLTADLGTLGISEGDVLIVHSSLSALGWVAGGAQSVVAALLVAVGAAGTIVMPAQSGQLSDPANWSTPAIPAEWVETVQRELPAFDPHLTPTRGMGQVVECFRQHPNVVRSPHPLVSFVAHGPLAEEIVSSHPLEQSMDDSSPLGRIYDRHGKVVLLGVDHGNNTSLHLAEHRAEWSGKKNRTDSAPLLVDGEHQWVSYEELDHDDEDFDRIGNDFAMTGQERTGVVGAGVGRLCSQRAIVDFAVDWMPRHRPGSLTA